jgi:hypothetical protein
MSAHASPKRDGSSNLRRPYPAITVLCIGAEEISDRLGILGKEYWELAASAGTVWRSLVSVEARDRSCLESENFIQPLHAYFARTHMALEGSVPLSCIKGASHDVRQR